MRRAFLLGLLALVALLALAYGGASWYMVGEAATAVRKPIEATPASVGLAYEDVAFPPRGGGLTLRGWYIPTMGADRGTLVLVHGLDSNKARDGKAHLQLVRALHDRGFHLLLFDLRGHGESEGGIVSAGIFESRDALGALDFVTEKRGARWEQVGLLGVSLGAATVLLAAESEPRLRALVADTPWAEVSDLVVREIADRTPLSDATARALLPGMIAVGQLRYGFRLSRSRPLRAIAALEYPVLLIHSTTDPRIPIEQSRRLKAAAKDPATELWEAPGEEHAWASKVAPEEYVRRVSGYFSARFGAALSAGRIAA